VFRNLLALVTGTVLLILGFMFSVVVFAAMAVLGLAIWSYLLWKTRKLRRAMQEQAPNGQVIEGEAIVVEEYHVGTKNVLPDDTPGQRPGSADESR
jgi:membrane protein implicated in regulation of membrane protease activity